MIKKEVATRKPSSRSCRQIQTNYSSPRISLPPPRRKYLEAPEYVCVSFEECMKSTWFGSECVHVLAAK